MPRELRGNQKASVDERSVFLRGSPRRVMLRGVIVGSDQRLNLAQGMLDDEGFSGNFTITPVIAPTKGIVRIANFAMVVKTLG